MGQSSHISIQQLVGQDERCLVDCNGVRLHRDVVNDWLALQRSAQKTGYDLAAASAFRSFDRQLQIWNDKVRGLRPVLDAQGSPIDTARLNSTELLFAILRWSALPGSSRHHWGTDVDVIDRTPIPAGYVLKLTDDEVYGEGLFAPLHGWLDKLIDADEAFSFYRPYQGQNSVASERWHLSHGNVSRAFESCLSLELLREFYQQQKGVLLLQEILTHFDDLYAQYIAC